MRRGGSRKARRGREEGDNYEGTCSRLSQPIPEPLLIYAPDARVVNMGTRIL